jgi:hypothetical protein
MTRHLAKMASSDSEAEGPTLTTAEKRKATRAANLAREEADNKARQEATSGIVSRH